jgi:hypothetical protein
MTGWILGGMALLAIFGYALVRGGQQADAVSSEWVREQIRERGRRRQA